MKSPLVLLVMVLSMVSWLNVAEAKAKDAHNYPTSERVLFVERCMDTHQAATRSELLFKCSCAIDEMAQKLSYEKYVEGLTAVLAKNIAGERGGQLRDSQFVKDMATKYLSEQEKAEKSCYLMK